MRDVLGDRAGEQLHLLRHDADLARGSSTGDSACEVVLVEQHAARIPASRCPSSSRTSVLLPEPGAPGDAQHRAGRRPRELTSSSAGALGAGVAERDLLDPEAALDGDLGAGRAGRWPRRARPSARPAGRPPRAPAGTGSRPAAIWRIGARARAERIEAATSAPTVISPATIMPGAEIDQDQRGQMLQRLPQAGGDMGDAPGLQPGPGAAEQMPLEAPLHVRLERQRA